MRVKAADLFCGAGGTSSGLALACKQQGKQLIRHAKVGRYFVYRCSLAASLSGLCHELTLPNSSYPDRLLEKAQHHTISTAAALANWHDFIAHDQSGRGEANDPDMLRIQAELAQKALKS